MLYGTCFLMNCQVSLSSISGDGFFSTAAQQADNLYNYNEQCNWKVVITGCRSLTTCE